MTSYLTPEQATEIIQSRLPSTDPQRVAWEQLSNADKSIYLQRAFDRIELLPYQSVKAVCGQSTQFPRRGHESVPEAVQQAQALEACCSVGMEAEANKRAMLQAQGVTGFSAGHLSESYGGANRMAMQGTLEGLYSQQAQQLLRPYIAGGVPIARLC